MTLHIIYNRINYRASVVYSVHWKLYVSCGWAELYANWTGTLNTERPCWSCFSASTCSLPTGWPASGTQSADPTRTMVSSTAGSGSWLMWHNLHTPTSGLIRPTLQSWSTVRLVRPCTWRLSTSRWRAWRASALEMSLLRRTMRRFSLPAWWSLGVSIYLPQIIPAVANFAL